jgi:hypothetical protein
MDILFPAFITLYNTKDNKTNIYYFRGLTDSENWIYQMFNEEQLPEHNKIINEDGSVIYEFKNKITNIKCKLVSAQEYVPDKIIFI